MLYDAVDLLERDPYEAEEPDAHSPENTGGFDKNGERLDPDNFTTLNVWISHSGITHPRRYRHWLLKVDSVNDEIATTPSIFELRLVIRIA